MIEELQTITDQLKQIPEDLGSQVVYLMDLSNLKWNISELTPKAKRAYNEKLAEVSEQVIKDYGDKKVTPSTLNGLIKGKLAQEQSIVDMCDRINSTINLQSQNLRTIISFKKGVQ